MRRIAVLAVFLQVCASAEPESFASRMATVIDVYAHPKAAGEPGYGTIAARLYRHEDPQWCSRRLQQLLEAGPSGDMFWMFPVTAIAYLDREQLTEEARQAL